MDRPETPPGDDLDLFALPADYAPASPPPTTATHTLHSGEAVSVRLVGHNPLWGHHLWNGGRLVSNYLETHAALVRDRTVLELGAGAGLPSLVAARLGARKVVVSDYPDRSLVQNLQWNIEQCAEGERVAAEGYLWGADAQPLLAHLSGAEDGFDVLILADLLFNHSEHGKLIESIKATLRRGREAKALVFFTPYRPWLYEKDMAFFELAREAGFEVEKVLEEKMERVMFEEDTGDEEVRRTVYGYTLAWSS